MIFGIGCDITEISRIERAHTRFGNLFINRILTPYEQEHSHGSLIQYLAGRFAAKEAAVKALGTGFQNGIRMIDIEIQTSALGAPILFFYEKALAIAKENSITKSFISISHERQYAVAFVILETNQ